MKIGVIGTGTAGQTIAAKFVSLGHDAMIGTRDVQETLLKHNRDGFGNPPFSEWVIHNPDVKLGTFAEAAAYGRLIVSAVKGSATVQALTMAGEDNLKGKIVIDIASPLDVSSGMPPSLFVSNTDSLGEQIQRAFPNTKVVKTLNTVNAHLMVDPARLADAGHTIFVSGNDAGAKSEVIRILKEWFGWKDVIDLGDISTARGTEMLFALWIRTRSAIRDPLFAFKVVR